MLCPPFCSISGDQRSTHKGHRRPPYAGKGRLRRYHVWRNTSRRSCKLYANICNIESVNAHRYDPTPCRNLFAPSAYLGPEGEAQGPNRTGKKHHAEVAQGVPVQGV